MSSSPYKRRKPSLVRNFWVYRRVVLLAFVLGVMLYFMWINNTAVTVKFPFGLGAFASTTGFVILLSVVFGSVVTAFVMTAFRAWRSYRESAAKPADPSPELPDDRPPPDYAAKTSEGFPDFR
ncbi:MAG TPA: DUF1049 domain-containing protein [Isosphaeraceae bacterium]|jgi:uncharacterized integral membrane protein|nr:DUF1049 domain-containing protein [Isosphaeraceae bacterium]